MKTGHDSWAGLMASCICLEQKDSDGRTADLKFVIDQCKGDPNNPQHAAYVDFAKLELANGDKAPSKADANKGVEKEDATTSTDLCYFYARTLELTGELDRAKINYNLVLNDGDQSRWAYVLSCSQLHELGVKDTPLPLVKPK
jgi:hypothetical protein